MGVGWIEKWHGKEEKTAITQAEQSPTKKSVFSKRCEWKIVYLKCIVRRVSIQIDRKYRWLIYGFNVSAHAHHHVSGVRSRTVNAYFTNAFFSPQKNGGVNKLYLFVHRTEHQFSHELWLSFIVRWCAFFCRSMCSGRWLFWITSINMWIRQMQLMLFSPVRITATICWCDAHISSTLWFIARWLYNVECFIEVNACLNETLTLVK